MTDPPCARPDCPVADPTPGRLRTVRSVVWPAGTPLRRGHALANPDPSELVPGVGDTRFAPLPGTGHVYVAATSVAALLESVLHDVGPPVPRIAAARLTRFTESAVVLTADVRLVDLRDGELQRLGVGRGELVATTPAHYPCTRRWAMALHGRAVGGHPTVGMVWNSRQVELQTAALTDRPAVRELMASAPSDVAVLWSPPGPPHPLGARPGGLGPLDHGDGQDFILDLAAALGVPVQ